VYTYTNVIKACALTRSEAEKEEAFRIAFSVFKQMTMEGIKPNEVTYVFLLNVCRFLIPVRERE
jgi:hypothetical protein